MSGGGAPRIELVGVSKRYGARERSLAALRELSVVIEAGEFVSVEGPSGCGKTTLLNLIGLLDAPSQGEIRWDGRSVASRSERERSRLRLESIGFIFQRFYLLPTLTAQENVELPMRAARVDRAARQRRARELLASMGIEERAAHFPHQLSGGEEQRVAIARALANGPGILLADEPTGELDTRAAATVLDLLESARARAHATLLVVTHNPAVAARAERHLTLSDGRLVNDRPGA